MTRSRLALALITSLAIAGAACKEEGPAEKAGRKMDEAVDKLLHPNEGPIERAGREMDDAFDDAKDEIKDKVEDVREDVADAIEGD
ncbi:MAG: hypothetical protein FJ091_01195 [Deltaproteobacteria bacterium]|nr:hypothetical protein [Deltaproteobacteria bacterium]